MSTKYDHMQEAWGLDGNPFPAEPIHKGDEPYDDQVFGAEHAGFFERLVFGALMDRRGFGYLWSKSPSGEDTGLGKTTLLRHGARSINADFGASVLKATKPERRAQHLAVAAYASLNTTDVSGVYPILFAAVEYLADPAKGRDGRAMTEILCDRIAEQNEIDRDDSEALKQAILKARRALGATLPPLRADALDAACSSTPGDFAAFLAEVSQASRARNGLQFFDLAFTLASAAGVPRFFVLIDQLEDLATTDHVPKAKRSREVGRLRDIISEMAPFAGKVHFVLTLHHRAAHALQEMWGANRLPSYDPEDPANRGSIVVLRGITEDEQARRLLLAYLNAHRAKESDDLMPFEDGATAILIERSNGRPGVFLQYAQRLLDCAADEQRPNIDAEYAAKILGTGERGANVTPLRGAKRDTRDAREIEDLLR